MNESALQKIVIEDQTSNPQPEAATSEAPKAPKLLKSLFAWAKARLTKKDTAGQTIRRRIEAKATLKAAWTAKKASAKRAAKAVAYFPHKALVSVVFIAATATEVVITSVHDAGSWCFDRIFAPVWNYTGPGVRAYYNFAAPLTGLIVYACAMIVAPVPTLLWSAAIFGGLIVYGLVAALLGGTNIRGLKWIASAMMFLLAAAVHLVGVTLTVLPIVGMFLGGPVSAITMTLIAASVIVNHAPNTKPWVKRLFTVAARSMVLVNAVHSAQA